MTVWSPCSRIGPGAASSLSIAPPVGPGMSWSAIIVRPVEQDRHATAHERDVVCLPGAGTQRRVLVRRQEAIDRADVDGQRDRAPGAVLDLHLVPPAQVHAAVAAVRVAKLDVQLEVRERALADEVHAALPVRQYAVRHRPLAGARLRLPARQRPAIEQRDRLAPLRSRADQGRRTRAGEGCGAAVGIRDRALEVVGGQVAIETQVGRVAIPLRRNGEAYRTAARVDARDRAGTADSTHKSAHQRAVSRERDFEPRGVAAARIGHRQVPAADDCSAAVGLGEDRRRHAASARTASTQVMTRIDRCMSIVG